MFLSSQFDLNAFQQPTANTLQRMTYALLGPSQSIGDFTGAKIFNVTQLEQLLVTGIELFPAMFQGNNIEFGVTRLRIEDSLGESI